MSFAIAAILSLASALSVPSTGMPMVQRLGAKLPDVDRTGQAAGADVGLWIGPDGKIISCELKHVVGDEALASLFCKPLIGFKIGKPIARDGSPAFGYTEATFTVFPNAQWSVQDRLMQELRKHRADAADENPITTPYLFVEVSEAGNVTACEHGNSTVDEGAAGDACESLIGRSLAPRLDASGRAVRYVRSFGSLVE